MGHNRVDNLKPFSSEQDRDKARENGRAGGIASGEARRWRRDIREFLQGYLDMGAPPGVQEKMAQYGVAEEDRTNAIALFISIFVRAMKYGDVNAASTVLEWAGQLPCQEKHEAIERERDRCLPDSSKVRDPTDKGPHDVVVYNPAVTSPTGETDQHIGST